MNVRLGIAVADTKPQSGTERRMVLRLLEFWREAKGDGAFPTPDQLNDAAMPELFSYCVVLDVSQRPTDPVVIAIGRSMSSYAGANLVGRSISQFEPNTLPTYTVAYVAEVLRKRVPISRGGSFVDSARHRRSCIARWWRRSPETARP